MRVIKQMLKTIAKALLRLLPENFEIRLRNFAFALRNHPGSLKEKLRILKHSTPLILPDYFFPVNVKIDGRKNMLFCHSGHLGDILFSLHFCKEMLDKYPDKIILPIDSVCSKKIDSNEECSLKFITDLNEDDIGLDIGKGTVELFEQYLKESKTVIWNGPLGMFELAQYQNGTKKICECLSKLDSTVIIGGGDTAAAAISFGYKESFTHISTGGGASLEMMEGKILPGIDVINDK